MLTAAAGRLEPITARVEQEVLAADRDCLHPGLVRAENFTPVQAGRDVKPVVEAPPKRVEHPLTSDVFAEAGQGDPAHVGLAVAVCIFEVEQVGRGADIDTSVPAGDGAGHRHVAGEDGALVENKVAIGVFKEADAALTAGLRDGGLVVLGKLGDVHPAVFVEVDRDGAAQQRLGGGQFDMEAGADCKRLECLGRIFQRDSRQLCGVVLLSGSRLQRRFVIGPGGCGSGWPPRCLRRGLCCGTRSSATLPVFYCPTRLILRHHWLII